MRNCPDYKLLIVICPAGQLGLPQTAVILKFLFKMFCNIKIGSSIPVYRNCMGSQPNKLLNSYFKGSDYNVICLDWDKLATIGVYLDAAINSNTVGDFVGEKLVADIFIATVRDF